jgi:probable HAF family extracellular repeat protein
MWKIAVTSVFSLLLVSGVLAAPNRHANWTFKRVLERATSIGITNSQRVLGMRSTDAAPAGQPFVWHRGNLVDLPATFVPVALNDSGQIAGSMPGPAGAGSFPGLWDQGSVVDLSTWPLVNVDGSTHYGGVAHGINNLGQVVGSAGKGVLWSNGSALQLEGPGPSAAVGINDSGYIVGWYSLPMTFNHRYIREFTLLWQGETLLGELPSPLSGARRTRPVAINNAGDVVGWSMGADGLPHAILWRNGTGIVLAPGAVSSVPTAINARGQVVGYSSDGTRSGAFVWDDGVLTELPSGDVPDGTRAIDINNRGDIIGHTGASLDTSSAVLWTR